MIRHNKINNFYFIFILKVIIIKYFNPPYFIIYGNRTGLNSNIL